MKRLHKWIILLAITLIFCFPYHTKIESKIYNHIVAVINEEIVTKTELHRILETLQIQAYDSSVPNNSVVTQLEKALQTLIDEKLQLQEAQKLGISVSHEEIDRSIREIKMKNGLTSDWELEKILLNQNMTLERLQVDIKKSILLLKLRERAVHSKINLTELEIIDYFNKTAEKKQKVFI